MKDILSRNIALKILSIVLAVTVWIMINGISDPVTTVTISNIPVQIINEDAVESENKIFEVVSGNRVDIKVRGKRSIVDSLTVDDFLVTADFREMSLVKAVPITVVCSTYDEEHVELVEKSEEMMLLALEDSDTKTFNVVVEPEGELAEGYYYVEGTTSPNVISLSGSKTQISKINRIAVSVNIENARASFEVTGTPKAYDTDGNVAESTKIIWDATEVLTSIRVLPTKEITVTVETEGEPATGYGCAGVSFAPQTIVIAGERADLNRISTLALKSSIQGAEADIEENIDLEKALEELYGDVFILVGETKTVSAKSTIIPLEEREISVPFSLIEFRNMPESCTASTNSSLVYITIMGMEQTISRISAADLKFYIDCTVTGTGSSRENIQMEPYEGVVMQPKLLFVTYRQQAAERTSGDPTGEPVKGTDAADSTNNENGTDNTDDANNADNAGDPDNAAGTEPQVDDGAEYG